MALTSEVADEKNTWSVVQAHVPISRAITRGNITVTSKRQTLLTIDRLCVRELRSLLTALVQPRRPLTRPVDEGNTLDSDCDDQVPLPLRIGRFCSATYPFGPR